MAEAGPPPSGNWWDDLQSSVTSFKLPDLPDIEMPNLTPPGTGNPFALWGNDAAVPAADGQEAAPTVLPTAPVQDPVAPVQVSRDVNVDLGAVGSRDVAFDCCQQRRRIGKPSEGERIEVELKGFALNKKRRLARNANL